MITITNVCLWFASGIIAWFLLKYFLKINFGLIDKYSKVDSFINEVGLFVTCAMFGVISLESALLAIILEEFL